MAPGAWQTIPKVHSSQRPFLLPLPFPEVPKADGPFLAYVQYADPPPFIAAPNWKGINSGNLFLKSCK